MGLENILATWQLGCCIQCYCPFITGRERLRGVPRSERLGSTIHLQINNLYVVLFSYNRINRCSVEEKNQKSDKQN